MEIQDKLTYIAEYNNPGKTPCVYVMWHGNQFCVHGIPDRSNLNILISTSIDGNIISECCHFLGYQTCRGSSMRRGAVSSTLKMIEKLKQGENIALMVDGPKGPLHSVKPGAIVLAREANVPIIPVTWYSDNPTFIKFPTWDKMTTPFGPCWLLNVYGEPIYTKDKTDEQVAQEIKESLLHIGEIAPDKYKEAKELKLWKKQKSK
jgi:lysophospholipid acyltransferase (LPLAT)-like uncharacterized protein